MRIIRGFKEAESLLSRKVISGGYAISAAFRNRLMEMYGTGDPEQVVKQIVDDVRKNGDKALIDYTLKIDNINLSEIAVSRREINEARYEIDRDLYKALEVAAGQIRAFHVDQKMPYLAVLRIWGRYHCPSAGQGGSVRTGWYCQLSIHSPDDGNSC